MQIEIPLEACYIKVYANVVYPITSIIGYLKAEKIVDEPRAITVNLLESLH